MIPNPKIERRNFRWVVLFFLFTTLSGAVRKWGVSSNTVANVILLVQLVFPFLLFIFLQRKNRLPGWVKNTLFVYTLVLIAMAFNPLNRTIYHGMLGIVIHLGFWLGVFMLLFNVQEVPLEKMIPLVFVILISELILGGMQYTLPFSHPLNTFAHEGVRNSAHVGDASRATGTFSYIGGYGALIVFAGYLSWAMGIMRNRMIWHILLFVIGLLMALFSGSRAPTVIFLGLSGLGFAARASITNIFGLGIGLVLVVLLAVQGRDRIPIIDRAITNLEGRFVKGVETGEQSSRIYDTVDEVIDFRGDYALFGTGLGATYQGATSVWGKSIFVDQYGFYEEEPERLILEGGYLLYLFKIVLLALLFYTLAVNPWISLGLFLFHIFFYPIVFNVYQAAFLLLGLAVVQRAKFLVRAKP